MKRQLEGVRVSPEPTVVHIGFSMLAVADVVTSTAAESTSSSRRSSLVVLLLTTLLLITLLPSSVGICHAGRSDVDLGRLLLNDSSHGLRESLESIPN